MRYDEFLISLAVAIGVILTLAAWLHLVTDVIYPIVTGGFFNA